MELKLTKEQYWQLLRATYMADWMANAICEGDMEEDGELKNIRNYIFSFAKEMGYEDFVKYDEEMEQYFATLDFDDEPSVRGLIERYDEDTAWSEFSEMLGERDFFKKYSSKERANMSRDEHFTNMLDCEIKWEEEFEDYGIDRLEIKEEEN